jgi:hypothetical protein
MNEPIDDDVVLQGEIVARELACALGKSVDQLTKQEVANAVARMRHQAKILKAHSDSIYKFLQTQS